MRIRYTRNALDDISRIHAYIANDNLTAAGHTISALRETIELLSRFPEIGRRGSVVGTREFVVARLPYSIVYLHTDTEVQILNIFHMAQDRG